jgi:hypothetical protein
MVDLRINYAQRGVNYIIEFKQNGNIVKRIWSGPSPDGNNSFVDTLPEGIYDIVVYSVNKTPCSLFIWFSWFNPNNNGSFDNIIVKRVKRIFNGRKSIHKNIFITNNLTCRFFGDEQPGKIPVTFITKHFNSGIGFFKSETARLPTIVVPNEVHDGFDIVPIS